LALFHHDPAHDDDMMDRTLADVRDRAAGMGLAEVIAAAEGVTVSLGE
jgi:hypothetical protein